MKRVILFLQIFLECVSFEKCNCEKWTLRKWSYFIALDFHTHCKHGSMATICIESYFPGWIREFNVTIALVRPNLQAGTIVMRRMALVARMKLHLSWQHTEEIDPGSRN